jgi:hypothetical protein
VTVSACAWDGCGSEIAVNTTKLLQKGNRVSTLITDSQPSGNPPSGSLLPELTAITVSDFSQDPARLC